MKGLTKLLGTSALAIAAGCSTTGSYQIGSNLQWGIQNSQKADSYKAIRTEEKHSILGDKYSHETPILIEPAPAYTPKN